MAAPIQRRIRLAKDPGPDRRTSIRFPLTLDIHYFVLHPRASVKANSSQTIDVSSSGLRFAVEKPLEPGLELEAAIHWPVLLHGRIELQLVVTGVIVWSSGTEAALQILRHDFRTGSVRFKTASRQELDGVRMAAVTATK